MTVNVAKVASISVGSALLAILYPYVAKSFSPYLNTFITPNIPFWVSPFSSEYDSILLLRFFPNPFRRTDPSSQDPPPFVCDTTHTYKTEIVSLDPLLVYIHALLTPAEITSLLHTAEPAFAPSEVIKSSLGHGERTSDRTSSSAGLPRSDPAVACVLRRARAFMGTMLRDEWDEMGPAQLVRYGPGERFNLHRDWYDVPRTATDGTGRGWNRVVSFFAVLEDGCTGGETHFPFVRGVMAPSPWGEASWTGEVGGDDDDDDATTDGRGEGWGEEGKSAARPPWREHEDGGLAFRPIAGNAVFWFNLHANGTGDMRTRHAGLPLESGRKTAMNIWPRQYYR